MTHNRIPAHTELQQCLHMALALIEEEGLVKIFRHLDRQRDESGIVAVVNLELDRGNDLQTIFREGGAVEERLNDHICRLALVWVDEWRCEFQFGTTGEMGYCAYWCIDFDPAGEVCASELDFVKRGDSELEVVA